MRYKHFYIIALLFVTIGLCSCKKPGVGGQSSSVRFTAQATHNFTDNKDEKELVLFLELDQVVLVREITMKIGSRKWDIEKPEINSAYSWLNRDDGVKESVRIRFTNDSLSELIVPKLDDYPDEYGHDWEAYKAADAKYQREAKKMRERIHEEVFTSMKKGEPVTFEIRGKMKNLKVTVPRSDIEHAIEVWDIYKQM